MKAAATRIMAMTELRWVWKTEFDEYRTLTTTKVLQYRTMQNLMEIGLQEPIWSEWMDVPEVEDIENE